ncbi:MAG: ketopantoate reductase family protein [Syntrophales bacterium]
MREVMGKRVAVLGTGAIGSSIGADLSKAGEEVTLIDQWPAHVEAMNARGLRVIMVEGELIAPVRAMHCGELCTLREPFDIVFITAKSYDTCWMVQLIKPYLRPNGVLVSLQNSLNDEWIAPLIGYRRDVAGVIELSAEILEPGVVQRNTSPARTWFAVGELHGRVTPRLDEIAGILGAAGKTEISPNIWGAKWSKLTVNCMSQAVSAILGISDWEISQNPRLLDLSIRLGRECLQVGTGMGYRAEPIFGLSAEEFLGSADDVLKKTLLTLVAHIGRKSRNSMLQDLCKERRSEIDFMNGLVAKKGREAGIPTPLNDEITSLVQRIERGDLRPAAGNLARVEKLI